MYGSSGSSDPQPDYAAAVYSLGGKSQADLQRLIDDEDLMDQLIRELPQVKQLYSEKEMLMASNKSLAEYNVSLEPKLNRLRVELQGAHREAVKSVEKLKQMQAEVNEKSGNSTDPDTMLAILQAAHSKAEEESEETVEKFLNQSLGTVDQFVEQFLEKRKIAHLRRIKAEKMKELLEAQRSAGQISNTTNCQYPGNVSDPLSPNRRAPAPPGPGMYPSVPTAATYVPPPNNWGSSAGGYPPPAPPAAVGGANLPYPIQPQGMPAYPPY